MKIITYNVNGIRSALSKNWLEWLKAANPDVVCLQEIKATPDQLTDLLLLEQMGYEHYWNPAEKRAIAEQPFLRKLVLNMLNTVREWTIMIVKAASYVPILKEFL